MNHCGFCHSCGHKLRIVLDGKEWCDHCKTYRRYRSHGWSTGVSERDTYGCFSSPAEAAKQQRLTEQMEA